MWVCGGGAVAAAPSPTTIGAHQIEQAKVLNKRNDHFRDRAVDNKSKATSASRTLLDQQEEAQADMPARTHGLVKALAYVVSFGGLHGHFQEEERMVLAAERRVDTLGGAAGAASQLADAFNRVAVGVNDMAKVVDKFRVQLQGARTEANHVHDSIVVFDEDMDDIQREANQARQALLRFAGMGAELPQLPAV